MPTNDAIYYVMTLCTQESLNFQGGIEESCHPLLSAALLLILIYDSAHEHAMQQYLAVR